MIAVKDRMQPRLPVVDVGGLDARQAAVDETVDDERAAVEGALGLETLAHGPVGLAADRVRGRHQQGLPALVRSKIEPASCGFAPHRLVFDLANAPAQPSHCRPGLALAGTGDRLLEARVLLPQDLRHHRRCHAGLLQETEGLAGVDGSQLRGVAHQRHAGDTGFAGNAEQRLHAPGVDHRGLVDRQHHTRKIRAGALQRFAVAQIAIAGEKGLQGPRMDAGLALEHPRRGGGGRQPQNRSFAQQLLHGAQHRRLAAAGMALDADHDVPGEKHGGDRLSLALGEAGIGEMRFDVGGERFALAAPAAQRVEDAPLRLHRVRGDEGALAGGDNVPAGRETGDGRVDLVKRVAPRRVAQSHGSDLGCWQHRAALGDVGDRPGDGLQDPGLRIGRDPDPRTRRLLHPPFVGELRQRRRPPGGAHDVVGKIRARGLDRSRRHALDALEAECRRPLPPRRHQFGQILLALCPARVERRHLRQLRRIGKTMLLEVLDDRPATPGEGVEEGALVACDLEPRRPPHHGGRDRDAVGLQAPGEFVAVVGADEVPVPSESRRLDALPLAFGVPGHVGDDAVGMELRVEIAAGQMPEPGRHQAFSLHPGPTLRLRIPTPRLDELPLDPVEGGVDRFVVGPDDPSVADHQALERHRLRRRQRQVPPRAVFAPAVALASQLNPGSRHPARKHLLEALRVNVRLEAQGEGPGPAPEARLAVFGIVLRVVAVLLVIGDGRRRGREFREARNHAFSPPGSGPLRGGGALRPWSRGSSLRSPGSARDRRRRDPVTG